MSTNEGDAAVLYYCTCSIFLQQPSKEVLCSQSFISHPQVTRNKDRLWKMIFLLTFVRHGLTDYNAQGLFQGHVDIPLNDHGLMQADLVGDYLENVKFDKIYSSDLTRCIQTVDAVVKKNKRSPPEVKLDARLREQAYGIYEGKRFSEMKRSHRDCIPGGETEEQVMERVESFLGQLCKDMTAGFSNQERDASEGVSPETSSGGEVEAKSRMDQLETESPRMVKTNNIPSFKELGYPVDSCHPHVLLSSHGMFLRILIWFFETKCNWKLSEGLSLYQGCPNTGLTGFSVEMVDGKLVNVDCKFLFCDHHLDSLEGDY